MNRMKPERLAHIKHWWNKFDTEIENHGTSREVMGIELLNGFEGEREEVERLQGLLLEKTKFITPIIEERNRLTAGIKTLLRHRLESIDGDIYPVVDMQGNWIRAEDIEELRNNT